MKNPLFLMISSLFLLNLYLTSYAQENSPLIKTGYWNEIYKSVVNAYGFDQVLSSGASFKDEYWGKVGHPFLFEDKFYKSTLVFREREYYGIDMKYDIYKQQVVLFIRQYNSINLIIPPNDFISAFSLGDKWFVKHAFGGMPRFYQVVFDTKQLKCLYYWSKSRYDSDHQKNFNSSKFTESKRKTYLAVDGVLKKYNNNTSFIRLFPQDHQQQIKQYLKNNKIKVAKSNEAWIQKLLIYCLTL